MDKLTGKTVLITGVLQGVNEGVARTFTRHSANLILLDISPEIRKLAGELCGRGHRCTTVVTGVHDPASVAAAIGRMKKKEGCIDILVNNAGVCRLGSFLDMSDDGRDSYIDINIKGVWNVTKAMPPEMIARKGGRVVMISSVIGDMVADPGKTAYALTKTAIVGLTKSLVAERVQSGIYVSAVCLGYVRILMAESIARQSNPEDPEPVPTKMAKAIPIRRLAGSLEVGGLAAFLVLGKSSYLIGIQNMIDDGSTLPETVSVDI